jgi:hypothetical protein
MCLSYFINRTEDSEVSPILQHALKLSEQHIQYITPIFNQEKLPIPNGFNENDVEINAPRLFTDTFYLQYLTYMARVGLHNYTLILNHISRSDIRNFFTNCINESAQLYNMIADIRLSKGIFIKPPIVEVPKEVTYVKSHSFITDFFGEKRPLLTREITHMFGIMLSNIVGEATVTAFGQVAKSKKVSDYFFKGRGLSLEQIQYLSAIHIDEAIPIPASSESYISDSTISPFSDKLMMFQVMAMNSMAITSYGMAFAEALRTDLHMKFGIYSTAIMIYAKEGVDIMIDENWLEQPPQAIKHENLVKDK